MKANIKSKVFKNTQELEFKILEKVGLNKYSIQFLKSGTIREASGACFLGPKFEGKLVSVSDPSYTPPQKVDDKIYVNSQNLKFRNLGNIPGLKQQSIIEFIDDGFKMQVSDTNFKYGKVEVKHPYKAQIFGVGYYGEPDPKYNGTYRTSIYDIWRNMLQRCYSTNHKNGMPHPRYYGKVMVCEEWHNFANFLKWITDRMGYDYNSKVHRIDKDMRNKYETKVYDPKYCLIVTEHMNSSDVGKQAIGFKELSTYNEIKLTIYYNNVVYVYTNCKTSAYNIRCLFETYKMKLLNKIAYRDKLIPVETYDFIENEYIYKDLLLCSNTIDIWKDGNNTLKTRFDKIMEVYKKLFPKLDEAILKLHKEFKLYK